MFCPGFCRSTGPVDRARSRSTGRSTDVHRRARQCILEGRSTDPVDRQRASALWKCPGRPGGRPAESSALCSRVSVDRPVDRCPNGQKNDRWRSTDSSFWLPTASFSSSINWDVWGMFSIRFQEEFWASFSHLFQWLYPQVWEQISPIKRGVLSRVFKSDFWVFLHHFNPSFLTQTLELSIDYSFYRSVVVRVFIGD